MDPGQIKINLYVALAFVPDIKSYSIFEHGIYDVIHLSLFNTVQMYCWSAFLDQYPSYDGSNYPMLYVEKSRNRVDIAFYRFFIYLATMNHCPIKSHEN